MATTLMPGEQPLTTTRQHWSVVAPALIAIGLVTAALLLVLFLIPGTVASLRISGARGVIAIVIVVVALVAASVRYLAWRCHRYVLTNRRVILETGVLSRNSESIAIDRIQNTIIHRPVGDRVIGAGNIEIESAGRDGTEVLHRVPHAEAFYSQLMQAIDEWRQGPASAAGASPRQSGL